VADFAEHLNWPERGVASLCSVARWLKTISLAVYLRVLIRAHMIVRLMRNAVYSITPEDCSRLTGYSEMHVQEKVIDLPAGHMLGLLERTLPHDVEALEDSAFLLTIAWPEDATKV
jgi:hypothetical protein